MKIKIVHGGKANHHANENAKYFNPLDGMNVDVVVAYMYEIFVE